MPILILGLLIFLGVHSLRIFAGDWRNRQVAQLGELPWKGLYAAVWLVGFALICWGFGLAREQPVLLYVPPQGMRHVNFLFTLAAFILVTAAYVPRNHLKAKFGHPMLLGVKAWALGHLLATGMLHDVVLFGAFLVWAIVLFIVLRRHDRQSPAVERPASSLRNYLLTFVMGFGAWLVFAVWLHRWLIGVNPMA